MYERLLLCRRKALQRDMEGTRSAWIREVVRSAYQCWLQIESNSFEKMQKKLQAAGNTDMDKIKLYTMVIRQLRHTRKYVTKRMESWRKRSLRYESRIFIGDCVSRVSGEVDNSQQHDIGAIEIQGLVICWRL